VWVCGGGGAPARRGRRCTKVWHDCSLPVPAQSQGQLQGKNPPPSGHMAQVGWGSRCSGAAAGAGAECEALHVRPKSAAAPTCSTVPSTSRVSVVVMVWRAIGCSLPTLTLPICVSDQPGSQTGDARTAVWRSVADRQAAAAAQDGRPTVKCATPASNRLIQQQHSRKPRQRPASRPHLHCASGPPLGLVDAFAVLGGQQPKFLLLGDNHRTLARHSRLAKRHRGLWAVGGGDGGWREQGAQPKVLAHCRSAPSFANLFPNCLLSGGLPAQGSAERLTAWCGHAAAAGPRPSRRCCCCCGPR
jgi:hypothetical protein